VDDSVAYLEHLSVIGVRHSEKYC